MVASAMLEQPGTHTKLCECGCGQVPPPARRSDRRWGLVAGQPMNYVKGHQRRIPLRWVEEDMGYETPCWRWLLYVMPSGYGHARVRDKKTTTTAHRSVYEELVGPIPDGLTLDHLCRNPICVNPAHLEPVTMRENTMRGGSPSAANARKTHCKRGHPLSGENLRTDSNGCRHCRTCQRDRDRTR